MKTVRFKCIDNLLLNIIKGPLTVIQVLTLNDFSTPTRRTLNNMNPFFILNLCRVHRKWIFARS